MPDAATPNPDPPRGPLAWLRANFLSIDVVVIGFLGLLAGWTLLSLVAPGARLYPYDTRFEWAEMSKLGLLGNLGGFLLGYVVFQRIGIRYHRQHVLTGKPGPKWMAAAHLVHLLSPMLLLPLVFNMLGAFIAGVSGAPDPDLHPQFDAAAHYDRAATWWDLELKRLDVAMLGTYLPTWFRQHHAPWLSGVMMLCYLSYYLSPFVAAGKQLALRDWQMVRRCGGVFVGTLVTTYMGYIVLPATGPRFEGTFDAWKIDHTGWFAARWWQTVLDEAEMIRWDAFPSGHVAVSVIALALAVRYSPRVAWVYAPFTAGLTVATIYFGYHYVTDVIAGFLFAAFGTLVVWPAVKWWDGENRKPGQVAR
ncbi:MAG: phosphatase PAP2 family protein [Planctomycetes bacterium]|nr:phosphatase PAP2 family protein [Planctomycetota bacterium]MCW8135361.1 phosphatase PAP2 family protein [Planctomycetota bacterium]